MIKKRKLMRKLMNCLKITIYFLIVLTVAYFVLETLLLQQVTATYFAYYTLKYNERRAFNEIKHFKGIITLYNMISVSEYLAGSEKPIWTVIIDESSKHRSLLEIQNSLRIMNPKSLVLSMLRKDLTDHELTAIKDITNIDYLWLKGTAITDESIPLLLSLPNLLDLCVTDTSITANGLIKIVRDIEPGRRLIVTAMHCKITFDQYKELKRINPDVRVQCIVEKEEAPLMFKRSNIFHHVEILPRASIRGNVAHFNLEHFFSFDRIIVSNSVTTTKTTVQLAESTFLEIMP